MIKTEAWLLYPKITSDKQQTAELIQETISFSEPTGEEVLVEPLYGCWEGNMTHAVNRSPIDICRERGEDKVVIGNAGVVRVLRSNAQAPTLKEGDHCWIFCSAEQDRLGYMTNALAYDACNTMGLLAKTSKIPARCLVKIPTSSRYSLKQWATFSIRYVSAWANWKVAYNTWRIQTTIKDCASPFVVAWGGGVALAELLLAKHFGAKVLMMTSNKHRISYCESLGISTIDRSALANFEYVKDSFERDPKYKSSYLKSESLFLEQIKELGKGQDVSIFIDNIGGPVYRATLKALGRQGVLTTTGWKAGMHLSTLRASECISQHQHIHTHYGRLADGIEAMKFADENDWILPVIEQPYPWDNIPNLLHDINSGTSNNYFPLFQVNPE